jgi:hypothetical protein
VRQGKVKNGEVRLRHNLVQFYVQCQLSISRVPGNLKDF